MPHTKEKENSISLTPLFNNIKQSKISSSFKEEKIFFREPMSNNLNLVKVSKLLDKQPFYHNKCHVWFLQVHPAGSLE